MTPVYKPLIGEAEAEAVEAVLRRTEISGSFGRHLEPALGRRPWTLLDLAHGTTPHAVEFVGNGIEVTGVDLNALAHGRERAPEFEFEAQAAGAVRTVPEHTHRHRLREPVELLEARM